MDDPKTTRCTVCASEYTDAEIATATACPNCGSKGLPCDIAQDIEIKTNWHELRILGIWASNWAHEKLGGEKDRDSVKALNAIIKRLEAQRKEGWPALTLFGEVQELPAALEKLGIECGGVSLLGCDGEQIYPPKPDFRIVEEGVE